MDVTFISNKKAFEDYCKALIKITKCGSRHEGEPLRYPCIDTMYEWDDPNGPLNFIHDFIYTNDPELIKMFEAMAGSIHVKFD